MTQNTPREILLALLRAGPVPGLTPQDWPGVVQLAGQHRISALLYRQLKTLGLTGRLPADLLLELHAEYLQTASRNARIYHELGDLFQRFQRDNIPAILLKGAFLAERVYGDVAARPMDDVDLLVRKNDLATVRAILQELDFSQPAQPARPVKGLHHFVYEHAGRGLYIEVHWDLIDEAYPMHVDIDALWRRSRATRLADIPLREMLPEDQILHLCIHTSWHVFEIGLRPICDLAETLHYYQDSLDWDCLRQRARLWNAGRCVYVNLRLARELLEAPVPDDWLNAFQPVDFEPRYLAIAREHLFASVEATEKVLPSWPRVVEFWASNNLLRKAALFWRRLFLPRPVLAMKYSLPPDSWRVFLYYPVRLKDLLKRNTPAGWQLLRGDEPLRLRAEEQDQVNTLKSWLFPE